METMETMETMEKVIHDVDSSGDAIMYIITGFEEIPQIKGFRISFRTYNVDAEIGGYETTLWVKNCRIELANYFVCLRSSWKRAEINTGGKINSYKINNKVPSKFLFCVIKTIVY